MNWREIFKRTGYVLIAASIFTFMWWISSPDDPVRKKLEGGIPFGITVVFGINIINMIDRVFARYYFKHVLWVTFLSWLGGFPLAFFLRGVSFGEYMTFCVWVTLLGFIGAFASWIWYQRELSHGEISSYLTPEQVVENLGKPKEIISSDLGTTYLYNKLKIFAPKEGGEIGGGKVVERIPPPLPDSILGFSLEQIVNDLGFPKRVINLDSKIIYFYKDMKIIFIDNKVVDVQ
jgi:hypothetical protein